MLLVRVHYCTEVRKYEGILSMRQIHTEIDTSVQYSCTRIYFRIYESTFVLSYESTFVVIPSKVKVLSYEIKYESTFESILSSKIDYVYTYTCRLSSVQLCTVVCTIIVSIILYFRTKVIQKKLLSYDTSIKVS